MALDIKYNVYYSANPEGPWTLANTTPIAHIPTGNQYTVSGLKPDVIYYFLIIGGIIDDGKFVSLVSQHIGPDGAEASTLGTNPLPSAFAKPFAPHIAEDSSLGHTLEIDGISLSPGLGHRITTKFQFTEDFEISETWGP